MQATNANLVMVLVRLAQVQRTQSAQRAVRGFFCNHCQQLALTLVQLDMVETLQLTLVCNAILLVRLAQVQITISVQPATQDIFCNRGRQRVSSILVRMGLGRIAQITFVRRAMLLARFV